MKNYKSWAVVVVQVVDWSLPTLEIIDSNPFFGKIMCTINYVEKMTIKKKRPGMAQLIFCKSLFANPSTKCVCHLTYIIAADKSAQVRDSIVKLLVSMS